MSTAREIAEAFAAEHPWFAPSDSEHRVGALEELLAEARRAALLEAASIADDEAEKHDPQEPYYERPLHEAARRIADEIRALAEKEVRT